MLRLKTRLAILALTLSSASAFAENRFYVDETTFESGQSGQQISLLCENDRTILGYSFAVKCDTTKMRITGVSRVGTVAEDADFFGGRFNDELAGYGCVFDTDGDFSTQHLESGSDQLIAIIEVEVLATPTATTTMLVFDAASVSGPPVKNVMTSSDGESIRSTGEGDLLLLLQDGTINIEASPVPVITGYENNSGMAGDVFTIIGANFDEAELDVQVCSTAASFQPPTANGTRLVVTAPQCGSVGPVEVEICNVFGCASDLAGFTYKSDVNNIFIRADADGSGDLDLTDGIRILNFLFLGGVSTRCKDAMDSNDSGDIDLTDGIYVFNFLFIGGNPPPPPYPDPGVDKTPDNLPECDPL